MLDGGAMFGVVPKSLWQKTNPADNNNMVKIAARCLLIEDGDRVVLIDTGMGDKQSEKFFGYYYRWGEDSLGSSLKKHGFHADDVTDVFLTHLHFDHCGGGVIRSGESSFETTFKNARYWSNKGHWDWAKDPNKRESASFLKENILPIEESGQLHYLEKDGENYLTQSDLGFDVFLNKQRVRLAGIDTPETRTKNPKEKEMGYEAKEFLEIHLMKASKLTVKTEKDGKYGRMLGWFYRNEEAKYSINEVMIEQGFAWEYDGGTKEKDLQTLKDRRKAPNE